MNETSENNQITIWPTLLYRDAPAAIRFLIEAFGFFQKVAYPGEDEGTITHAELGWPGGGGVMLGSVRPDSTISELPPGTGSIYIYTDDPDGLFERACAAGARIVLEVYDTDHGSRDFTVRDPEGVYWSFGTYRGA
ncbi:MAG: VOC family protein [Solirubrobacteraceae bacterium]